MKNKIREEKEQLLEMAIKLGRLTSGNIFNLDYLHWNWNDLNDDPVFYLSGMQFIKTDDGWISYVVHDIMIPGSSVEEFDIDYEKNVHNGTFRTEKRPVITEPISDIQELFRQTTNAKLSFLTEWFLDIYNRKKELKHRLERMDELEGKYKSNRKEKQDFISSQEYYDTIDSTIDRLLNK